MTNLTTILSIMAMSVAGKWTVTILISLAVIAVIMILGRLVTNALKTAEKNDQSTLSSMNSTDMRTNLEKEVNSISGTFPKVIMEHKLIPTDNQMVRKEEPTSQSDIVLEANDLKDNKGIQAIEESPIVESVLQAIKERFLANRTRNQVKDWLRTNFNKTEAEAEQLVKKALKRYEMAYDHDTQHYDFKANIEARRKPSN